MKRILRFVLVAALTAISCTKESNEEPYNPDGSPITQAQALEIVKEDIEEYDMVYCSKTIIKKNTKFATFNERYGIVPCDSWIIMIDSNPLQNGGPKWLYIYVNAYSGDSDVDSWEWALPRNNIEYECIKNVWSEKSTKTSYRSELHINRIQEESIPMGSNNWAVIISGGSNPESNYSRYWNDCSIIYKCLRNIYNYRDDRIIVIMSDGKSDAIDRYDSRTETFSSSPQDLDGDGIDDINYSATKSNISKVFDYLESNVSSDEQVLVYVTDHGDIHNGKSSICLWNNTMIMADDFAMELKKINSSSRKHVVLGQCFSGGFIAPLLSACDNISVATASAGNEYSFAMENGEYDEFLYHWVSAAAGKTPDGAIVNADLNGYEGVSAEEIFRYSQDKDEKDEIPQYASSPSPMGERYGLSGEEFGYPIFTAESRHLTSDAEGYLFELSNLSRTYTTEGSSNKNSVYFRQNTQSSVRAFKDTEEAMAEDQVKVDLTTSFKTYSFKSDIYLWESGINFTETLIGGSLSGGSFFLPFNCSDVRSYEWMIDGVEHEVVNNGAHFIDFMLTGEVPEEYAVSVSFENPSGGGTTIVRRFYQ